MECKHCRQEIPDDVEVCVNCGADVIREEKPWHSLHKLLWDNKIDQDILDSLNELCSHKKHFIGVTRKIDRAGGR